MRPSLCLIAPLLSLALGCATTQASAPNAPPQSEAERVADCERRYEAMQRAQQDANSDPRVLVNDRTRDLPPRTSSTSSTSSAAAANPCRQHGQVSAAQAAPPSREDEVAIARTRARVMLDRGQHDEALSALKPAFYEGAPAADAELRALITELDQAMTRATTTPKRQCVGSPIPLNEAAPAPALMLSEQAFQVRCPISADQGVIEALSVQVVPRGGAAIATTPVAREGAWVVVNVTMPAPLQGQRVWLDLALIQTLATGAPTRSKQGQLIWFSPYEQPSAPASAP